jgi:hypothetical protein
LLSPEEIWSKHILQKQRVDPAQASQGDTKTPRKLLPRITDVLVGMSNSKQDQQAN